MGSIAIQTLTKSVLLIGSVYEQSVDFIEKFARNYICFSALHKTPVVWKHHGGGRSTSLLQST